MDVCTIRDYAQAFSGYAFSSEDLVNVGYPVLKIGNIQDHHILKETESFYNKDITEKLKKYRLQKGDFLIAMTGAGSVGRAGKMIDFEEGYLVNQRVAIIRPDISKTDPEYLFYYFSMRYVEKYLYNLGIGAGQPNISANDILKTKVCFPDLAKQKKIGEILSTYDDLIENNNRRIALLEKAAQELYKEWFVRFRFPGYENAKFENGLPEGWKIAKLGTLCKVITGKKDANEATGQGIYPFFTCARETTLFTDEYILDTNAILISGNGSYTGLVKKHSGKFDLYQRTYALYDFQNIEWLYLYWTMKIDFEREFMGGSRGSAIPYITRPNIEKFKIIVPTQDIMERAQHTFEQIHNKCLYLERQNKNLVKQRDLLLPRLMSGKLEV